MRAIIKVYIIFAGILFHNKALKTAYAVKTNKHVLDFLCARQNISVKCLDPFTFSLFMEWDF